MKKIAILFGMLVCFWIPTGLIAQTANLQLTQTFSAVGSSIGLSEANYSVGIHHVSWTTPLGTPASCTFQLQTAPDNLTWTNIGNATNCNVNPSGANSVYTQTVANFVRVNVTALTAASTLQVTITDPINSVNTGFFTGQGFQANITPTATAAAIGIATQTFTFTGLNTNDLTFAVVLPTPTALCPPVGFRATSSNTLSIDFAVLTAAACTPAAGIYAVGVLR